MKRFIAITALLMVLEAGVADLVGAVQLEPTGKAVAAVLGVNAQKPAFQYKDAKAVPPADLSGGDAQLTGPTDFMVFYTKGADGKADRYAFVQNWIWQRQCKHGWVIGVDAKAGKVTEVRFTDMQCPHASPIRDQHSFHEQFQGKGPADAPALVKDVHIVANATGSAKLAARAVKEAIELAGSYRGKF